MTLASSPQVLEIVGSITGQTKDYELVFVASPLSMQK